MQSSSFPWTRWSIVLGAGSADVAVRRAALERLCAQYWHPLYAYLRRRGRAPEDAADLVQGLFSHLLSDNRIGRVTDGPGRFRSWLLAALQNHERDVRDREQAQKRGGGRPPIPIDPGEGERRLGLLGPRTDDPVVAFERAWGLEVLASARALLGQELRSEGKGQVFDAFEETLDESNSRPRQDVARELGMTAVALRVTLHRLRVRYREMILAVVADSTPGSNEAGEELRTLARALE